MANLNSDDGSGNGVATSAGPAFRGVVGDEDDSDDGSAQALSDGKWYALVVGIDTYSQGITPLKGAVADAKAVIAELARKERMDRYEKVFSCIDKDASRAGLMRTFAELRRTLRGEKNARLFIYYAGHGIAAARPEDAALKTPGYFIPHDARLGNKRSYLSMKTVERAINRLKDNVRHLLLVLDCCFAGAFRWSGTQFRDLESERGNLCLERFKRFLREPSWHVITSSAQDERALDTIDGKVMLVGDRGWTPEDLQKEQDSAGASSPFAVALLHGLRGDADLKIVAPADSVITGSELHFYVAEHFNSWEKKAQRPLQKPMMFPWPTKQNCKGEFIFLNPKVPKLALLPTPVLDEEHIPYYGLNAYQEKNQDLYFGRAQAKKQLCEKVKGQGLTVVVGASGTGKSSLVFAGLVPCLREEKPAWHILTSRQPGQCPLAALAAIATELGAPNTELGSSKTDRLAEAVATWCGAHPRTPLLLIIDQLEELITQSTPEDRAEFLRRLEAARATNQLHVVLTLRSDFEPHFRELLSPADSTRFLIPHVSRAELHEMIERPANSCELSFDPPQLVESLADEVLDAPGALPLLSFTLREMVRYRINNNIKQDRTDRTLSREDYEKLGGVSGALSKRADEIYGSLDSAHQATLRRLILRMVAPGEYTRRRVLCSELVYDDQKENARVEAVRAQLVAARLLVTSMDNQKQPCVEPAHDKLVMGWQRLRTFIEEDKAVLPLARSLTQAVQEWEQVGRHSAELWSGDPRLPQIRALRREESQRFNAAETAFIRSSIRRQRNIWISIVGTALLTIVGLSIAFIVAKKNAAEAKKKSEESYANLLVSVAQRVKEDPLAVTNLLREPGHQDSTLWSQSALDVLQTRIVNPVLRGHGGAVSSVAFSPDGKKIVTGSSDKTARIWNADGFGSPVVLGHRDEVNSVAFSPDGKKIVTGSQDGTARIWNADGSGSPVVLQGREAIVTLVAFSPDGKQIVAGGDDSALIWNADGSGSPVVLKEKEKEKVELVTSVAFSPDGKKIVTGLWGYCIRIWNTDGSPVGLLGGGGNVYSVAFSPDGKQIVEGSNNRFDHVVRIMNADGSGSPVRLLELKDNFTSVAFSPDGKKIVAGNHDYTARIKNADGSGSPVVLQGHEAEVTSVAFSPDGKKIVTGSLDQTARVWNADGSGFPVVLPGPQGDFSLNAAFSSDGKKIVTQSQDYSVLHIWNSDGSGSPVVLKVDQKKVGSVAFSSDGKKIVIGSEQDTVRIFNADGSGSPLVLLHDGIIHSVAFSPDGKRVASAGVDITARIFNVDGSGVPVVLKHHGHSIQSVAFSSDGQKIVTGESEGLVRMSNADGSGSPLDLTHGGEINAVAFSPDGKRIASCSSDQTARIWNADGSGTPVVLEGHKSGVYSVAFSPDGKQVVTGGADGTVRIWNADGSGSAVVLEGYKAFAASINWATFSPDGKQIVSMGFDNTMRIWTVASDLLVEALWSATNDCLPEHRRQQLLLESPADAKQRYGLCRQEVARRRGWPVPPAP